VPGNKYVSGFIQRQYSRRVSRSVSLKPTSRSRFPRRCKENGLAFAANWLSTQLTNLAAAESRIRDADLAAEAANLTKAQILLQAGTAAVAQANSSSQAVLALLR
jgi:flagellin